VRGVKRRLALITEIISPYRIPLLNVLAKQAGVDLHVIFLAETDPDLRKWKVRKDEINFSYQVLPSWRKRVGRYNWLLNRGLGSALSDFAPDVVLCGGYNYVASWQALLWSRMNHVPFLLWSESNVQDIRHGHAIVEFMKSKFLSRCSGFVVPGRSAGKYLRSHKIREELIFVAPNAVDNELFATSALEARQQAETRRTELALPQRYFLFVGRLVREKGVFELLSAYAKLDTVIREQVGLVLAGDGAERAQLEAIASTISPGRVSFPGFAQRELLTTYYALAEVLILPTYTDPWGLVVNEAMACGLPVIVSQVAGCAADLVTENWNGLLTLPRDESSLVGAMAKIATQPELRKYMSANCSQRISHYSPDAWSQGIMRALEGTGAKRD
jgi:glycosyltransferase involved in cell wall biosynthesis